MSAAPRSGASVVKRGHAHAGGREGRADRGPVRLRGRGRLRVENDEDARSAAGVGLPEVAARADVSRRGARAPAHRRGRNAHGRIRGARPPRAPGGRVTPSSAGVGRRRPEPRVSSTMLDLDQLLVGAGLAEVGVRGIRIRLGHDPVHDVHALHDLAERRVLVVEGRVVLEDDEELRRGRVGRRGAGHRDDAALVGRLVELRLQRDRIPLRVRLAGVSPDEGVLRVLRQRIAALQDEAGDDAVEERAVVEARRREVDEVLHVIRGAVEEEADRHVAALGVEDGQRMGVVVRRRLGRRLSSSASVSRPRRGSRRRQRREEPRGPRRPPGKQPFGSTFRVSSLERPDGPCQGHRPRR